jgi:PAS domain S-box-containing protein
MNTEYQNLFEAMPHPYLVLRPSPTFEIAYVNDRYLAATRTRRAEVVGRGLFEIFPDNPADPSATGASDLRASLAKVLRDCAPDVMGVQKYDIPDGEGGFEIRYWSPVNTPVPGDDGTIAYIIHHVEDVTEFVRDRERVKQESGRQIKSIEARRDRAEAEVLRRADEIKTANRNLKAANNVLERKEKELSALYERLRELDVAKSAFFANASHELRTPLALILGPIEHLLEEDSAASPRRERLETAYRNALRLQRQVNAVLEFSRIEADGTRPDLKAIDLPTLTIDLVSNFRSACEAAKLSLDVKCGPLPGLALVDAAMWETIVLNLLSNAFKFTLKGGISVTLRAIGDGVELTVRDSGIGIPPDQLPHVFEKFHRGSSRHGRTAEGSGIGLALVSELARMHGGSAHVESIVGVGSAFVVVLPEVHFEAEAPPQNPPKSNSARALAAEASRWVAAPAAEDDDGARPLVVIADDNSDMRDFLGRLLRSAGYRVAAAGDGETALQMCRARRPALLLCDVMMPGLNGLELTRRLRLAEDGAALPIVLFSARAGEAARIEGFSAGADEYLEKPFATKELVARIDAATRLARARTELDDKARRIATLSRLAGIVETAMDAVISIDSQQKIVLFNGAAEKMFGCVAGYAMGRQITDFIPQRFRAAHDQHVRKFGSTGVSGRTMGRLGELAALRADGVEFPIEASISQMEVEGEKLFTVILRDISERVAAAETQRLLIGELDHRVKNTLAMVQSLAAHSLKSHGDGAQEFVASFGGRLQSLASTHDLLTSASWRGVELSRLIRNQLALFSKGADHRIALGGPDLFLRPNFFSHLGLVLHELGANAYKHGALSSAAGRIEISWATETKGIRRLLRIRWIESGGPAVETPVRKGFGVRLIETSLATLGGKVKLEFGVAGLRGDIVIPIGAT